MSSILLETLLVDGAPKKTQKLAKIFSNYQMYPERPEQSVSPAHLVLDRNDDPFRSNCKLSTSRHQIEKNPLFLSCIWTTILAEIIFDFFKKQKIAILPENVLTLGALLSFSMHGALMIRFPPSLRFQRMLASGKPEAAHSSTTVDGMFALPSRSRPGGKPCLTFSS